MDIDIFFTNVCLLNCNLIHSYNIVKDYSSYHFRHRFRCNVYHWNFRLYNDVVNGVVLVQYVN